MGVEPSPWVVGCSGWSIQPPCSWETSMSSSRPAFRNKPMAQVKLKVLLSRVRLFVTRWTVAHQAPLFMGFSRQEYWSGFLCPLLQGIFMTERLRCYRKYEHKAQQKPSYQAPPRCEWIKFLPRTPAPCSHAALSCWHPPRFGIPGPRSEWRPSCPWHAGCQFSLSSSSCLGPSIIHQVPTAHPGRGRELPFHPQAPCSEPTNRTAASLPGDGPGESSSFSVLPEPKRSWAGTCPGCSQPMPVDDSGDFSSLDTLLWQKTECLLQTFLKNNFCQGWEIWTLSHQRWRLRNEACVLGCHLVAPCGPWVQKDRQQGQGIPSFCSVAVAWNLAKHKVQVLLPRLAQSPGRQQTWAETEGQGQRRASTHPVNKGALGKENQEPLEWQETTHFGVIDVLEAKTKLGKVEISGVSL